MITLWVLIITSYNIETKEFSSRAVTPESYYTMQVWCEDDASNMQEDNDTNPDKYQLVTYSCAPMRFPEE